MYRFGGVTVDPRTREVRVDGGSVHLEPQAFDLLVHLIEQRDQVVAKPDLLAAVWGHQFVSEAALTTRVKEIRRAVGDDGARQRVIRNVRGRGYRFVADLQQASGPGAPDELSAATADELFGRSSDLDRLVTRLTDHRLVTVVGPGGVGKSTLARAALRHVSDSGHEVHVVELAAIDADDAVLPAVAAALDTVLDPDWPEQSINTIARRRCVLALDNCEHLADAVAHVVDRIFASPAVGVRVLATSQVRLGVAGEQLINLAPLEAAEAVALFSVRADAVRGDWRPETTDPGRVRRLVQHLDCLPLMIEMAAARLASMTFGELEQAVGEGVRLVQMTHRTPTPRHRTPASVVEWSAGLLAPDDRRAFVEFSVFAGAVSAADAEAVLGPAAPIALGELTDRSLLAVDLAGDTARYRMLDTVRTVARGWLATSDTAFVTHRRHAAAIADATEAIDAALRSQRELAGRARLHGVLAEIRAAYRWSASGDPELLDRLSHALHVAAYGRLWTEPATWAAAALDAGDGRAPGTGARLLLAGRAANSADLGLAERLAESVLDGPATARSAGTALEILSDVSIYSGRLDTCQHRAAALDEIGRSLGDAHMITVAAVNDALAATFSGQPRRALERLQLVRIDDMPPSAAAWIAYARGEAYSEIGDHDPAISAYEQAITTSVLVSNPFVMSVARSSLAAEHARCNRFDAAYRVYADCFRGYLRHGNLVHAVTTVRNLVSLLHADRRSALAATLGTAVTADGLRQSYGDETARLGTLLADLEASSAPEQFTEWRAAGEQLDLLGTIRLALDAVEPGS